MPGGSASDTCFKLFGFDIFIDEDLKPWLLEVKILALVSRRMYNICIYCRQVNNIPSLHINTLDAAVNRPMVAEMLNIAGLRVPAKLRARHPLPPPGPDLAPLQPGDSDGDLLDDLVADLGPGDLGSLVTSEDEVAACCAWTRIFPTPASRHLHRFYTSVPRWPSRYRYL